MARITQAQTRRAMRGLVCLILLGVGLAGALTAWADDSAWQTAVASSYGPGLYGNRTACGQTLTTTTVGVAHKTLACGTRLQFQGEDGAVVYAEVIDRGPYTRGRTFDLTEATVQQLGYSSAIDFGVRTVSWDYR